MLLLILILMALCIVLLFFAFLIVILVFILIFLKRRLYIKEIQYFLYLGLLSAVETVRGSEGHNVEAVNDDHKGVDEIDRVHSL